MTGVEKELYEMTLEELWALFPIFLVEHDDNWQAYYSEVEAVITKILAETPLHRISHIGSTAVKGIMAKNIVDVLVELPVGADMKKAAQALSQNGFIIMSESEKRISLNRGYTKHGFADKVYHVHLRFAGDNDELYFRDYLNENPDVAREYEALKLSLWKRYEHDRDAYTEAKTEFIRTHTQSARALYGERYD